MWWIGFRERVPTSERILAGYREGVEYGGVVVAYPLYPLLADRLGTDGLALASAIAMTTYVVALTLLLKRWFPGVPDGYGRFFLRIVPATALAIGAGIGGFSTQRCAEILLEEARAAQEKESDGLRAELEEARASELRFLLGHARLLAGDAAGARAAFERALKIDEAAFGPDHPKA